MPVPPPPAAPIASPRGAPSPGDAPPPARIGAALGFLAVVAALAHVGPLFLGRTFLLRDHLTYTLPSRSHLAAALSDGRLPEWWDTMGLGVPFAANPMHGVLYPPAWLVAALPSPLWGADLLLVLHLLLAGAGALLLARRLGAGPTGAAVSGAALMTSGYASSVIVNGIPLLTLAWTPWVAWAADRLAAAPDRTARAGRAAHLSALVALQILSGDPAGVVTSAVLALLVFAARAPRPWRAAPAPLLALGAAPLLAAVLVVPAVGLLGASGRAAGLAPAASAVWSMHPLRILEWVWPHLLGDPTRPGQAIARVVADTGGAAALDPAWAASLHVGLAVLVLAVSVAAGRERWARWLGAASVLFVLLALGRFTPIHAAWRWLVLPERVLRYPEKHIAGALVLWTALAGVGFTRALGRPATRRLVVAATAAAAGLAALVLVASLLGPTLAAAIARRAARLRLAVDATAALRTARHAGLVAALAGGALAAALALSRSSIPRRARLAPALGAVAVLAPLLAHGWSVQPLVPRALVERPPVMIDRVLERAAEAPPAAPPDRLYRARSLVASTPLAPEEFPVFLHETAADCSAPRFGVGEVPGYDPAFDGATIGFWRAVGAAPVERVLDLLGVRWAIIPTARVAAVDLPVRSLGLFGYSLVENEVRRPRAFVTSRWRWLADDADVRRALLEEPKLDLGAVRLQGGSGEAAPPSPAAAGEPAACRVTTARPERVELACASVAGGYAVLLDAWAPGWSATVDGVPARVERADLLARAVRVPAGAHVVRFAYRTPGLRLGALVSGLAWLAWSALVLACARRARGGRAAGRTSEEGRAGARCSTGAAATGACRRPR